MEATDSTRDSNESTAARAVRWLIFAIGLAMALGGLGNSTPAFGPLPRIGPFDVEAYRALLMSGGVLVCILSVPAETWFGVKSPAMRWPMRLFDVIIGAVALYAFWRFYVIVTELDEGIFFFEPWEAWTTIAGCAAIILMCWRIWGVPLALVGIVMLVYFFTGPYWPGIFKTAPVDFIEDTAGNLWFNNNDGVLGSIMGIVTSTIFPFILLGAMLEASGGGRSLIKIAFAAMRNFRGGPAHAAILASGLFGTISGSAVANVVGTGVITIPMIKRRGFRPEFAGGVEATASTGGQVMPPIMGAAALVMADFTGISYLTIIICAIIPALAYYGSLFVVVVFESRRLGVEAGGDEEPVEITLTDYINLILVVVPIVIVVMALILGASPAGSAILALFSLIPLSFLNPDIRRRPFTLVEALARGGANMGRLMMAAGVVGITVGVLGTTGLPNDFALAIAGAAEQYLIITLVMAAAAALVLGMGMPTLPAYLTIVLILGPSMLAMGLTPLTSHMFVFYFGVASVITPPVAIAAYAAASIAGGGAIATSIAAVRIGVVIFAIPFAFALNPEMLIVSQADPGGQASGLIAVVFMVLRLCLMILLFASATSRFDATRISLPEAFVRFGAGILLIAPQPQIYLTGAAIGLALIVWNRLRVRDTVAASS